MTPGERAGLRCPNCRQTNAGRIKDTTTVSNQHRNWLCTVCGYAWYGDAIDATITPTQPEKVMRAYLYAGDPACPHEAPVERKGIIRCTNPPCDAYWVERQDPASTALDDWCNGRLCPNCCATNDGAFGAVIRDHAHAAASTMHAWRCGNCHATWKAKRAPAVDVVLTAVTTQYREALQKAATAIGAYGLSTNDAPVSPSNPSVSIALDDHFTEQLAAVMKQVGMSGKEAGEAFLGLSKALGQPLPMPEPQAAPPRRMRRRIVLP